MYIYVCLLLREHELGAGAERGPRIQSGPQLAAGLELPNRGIRTGAKGGRSADRAAHVPAEPDPLDMGSQEDAHRTHILTSLFPPSVCLQDRYTCTFTYASQGGTNEVSRSESRTASCVRCRGCSPGNGRIGSRRVNSHSRVCSCLTGKMTRELEWRRISPAVPPRAQKSGCEEAREIRVGSREPPSGGVLFALRAA